MNIWKIGSRWSSHGSADKSVLDIFRKYQIVFAGKDTTSILKNVKVDDYIAISDGLKIVAISKVRELPKKITDFTIQEEDKKRFDYVNGVIGIKVHIVDLEKNDYVGCKMGTFHKQNKQSAELIDHYNKENKNFSIDAKTYKIFDNEGNNFLKNNEKVKYKIPIYQRPYSWGESNVRKFISDIITSYCDEEGNLIKEPIFFGSMQFSTKRFFDIDGFKFEQDVIDGQQRLSTILVLIKTLQLRFPEYHKIQNIQLNWLETQVNNHTQNELLLEFLNVRTLENLTEKYKQNSDKGTNNKYIQNAHLMSEIIENFENDCFLQDEQNKFDAEDFMFNHVFKNLFFVVIETKASLSKTLQIFDTINTTGLDLKGTDVFKIRFYEFLKDKKNQPDSIFNDVNALYERIDEINKGGVITSMEQILGIYQAYLIGKYKLSNQLYSYNVNTFFERLFDSVLNINKQQDFTNLPVEFELSIEELNRIIDARISFHQKNKEFSQKTHCEYRFIRSSRYGRYWSWVILFYLNNGEDNLNKFISKLSKALCIYSVKYQKAVNEVHSKMRKLNLIIQEGKSFEVIDKWLNEQFFDKEKNSFEVELRKSIAHNAKWKFILCRTSAMLEDENNPKLYELLFSTRIDIEHIQSYNDKDKEERENIKNEWREEINSIGNLVILEENINRGIGNNEYLQKKIRYEKSEFKIVKEHTKKYEHWNLDGARQRKKDEVNKLLKYYFS